MNSHLSSDIEIPEDLKRVIESRENNKTVEERLGILESNVAILGWIVFIFGIGILALGLAGAVTWIVK